MRAQIHQPTARPIRTCSSAPHVTPWETSSGVRDVRRAMARAIPISALVGRTVTGIATRRFLNSNPEIFQLHRELDAERQVNTAACALFQSDGNSVMPAALRRSGSAGGSH